MACKHDWCELDRRTRELLCSRCGVTQEPLHVGPVEVHEATGHVRELAEQFAKGLKP